MFGIIGANLGGAVFGGIYGKDRDKHSLSNLEWISSAIGVTTSGIVIDAIIGVAVVVIGALVVAHVIPLPMAVGTALITGGGLYILLGFVCGINIVSIIIGLYIGNVVKRA